MKIKDFIVSAMVEAMVKQAALIEHTLYANVSDSPAARELLQLVIAVRETVAVLRKHEGAEQ